MFSLDQLIKDGYIFIREEKMANKGTILTIPDYGDTITVEIFPQPINNHSIPIKKDIHLYNLLKKKAVDYKTLLDVDELRKELKDTVSNDFDVIESIYRMKSFITIKKGESMRSVSLIGGSSIYTYPGEKKVVSVEIYRERI